MNTGLKGILLAASVVCALALAACMGGDDDEVIDPNPPPDIALSAPRVFANLSFIAPVAMLQAPADSTRWFVVEQNGTVQVFDNDEDVEESSEFIDIGSRVTSDGDGAGSETGLLGMAFHPDFPADPRVYLSYTAMEDEELVSYVSEFRTEDDGDTLDPDSEVRLLRVLQPQNNHNGGNIAFGPDGMLYIGFGDGGGSGDEADGHGDIGNGQDTQTLLGKMLRIDVTLDDGEYAIPAGNPFSGNVPCGDGGVGDDDCPEIYASGFRNPWRWSFDSTTGDLWVGDVGQDTWEEVDKVVAGGNYGWRCFEATHEFNSDCGDADEDDMLAPVAEYDHDAGISVTGGYVYHGTAIADLAGRYVFGDYQGRIWSIAADADPTVSVDEDDSFDSRLQIASFAEDTDGELYIVDHSGTLHRLEAN